MHALMPLMFLLSVLAPQTKDAPQWKTMRSAAGRFSVSMPGTPVETKQVVELVFGKVTVHAFSLEMPSGAYVASYNDYPPKLVKKSTPAKMLSGARNGVLQMVKGKLLRERTFKLQGRPGIEFSAEVPQRGAVMTVRVVLSGSRLYQALAIGEKGKLDGASVSRYLGSLKLL